MDYACSFHLFLKHLTAISSLNIPKVPHFFIRAESQKLPYPALRPLLNILIQTHPKQDALHVLEVWGWV